MRQAILTQNRHSAKMGYFYLPMLASCAVAGLAITAEAAHAHEDITDVLFTDRTANCAHYVDTYSAEVTDMQNAQSFSASLAISRHSGGPGRAG